MGGKECLSGPILRLRRAGAWATTISNERVQKTRGRSRKLIAGGPHERQIVLALSNDRMFLAAATVGRPSACASPTIPKQVGHNHLGFGCRQHARCRPSGDCRSAEPELGPTSPGGQSSRCRRQHRFANCSRLSARWIHALYAGPVHLRVAARCRAQSANPAPA